MGTLASDDLVVLKQVPKRLDDFDAQLQHEHQQALKDGGQPVFRKLSITYKGEKETYYLTVRPFLRRFDRYGFQPRIELCGEAQKLKNTQLHRAQWRHMANRLCGQLNHGQRSVSKRFE